MDENNLDSLLDELSSMDGELNENIDIDSGVDVDADDMDDISLDELDHLDGMDLGDLDFDDSDFDDVDITKLDAGSIVLEKKPEDVAEMMNNVELRFSYRAEQEQKKLVLFGEEDIFLSCDRDWILEAVDNIVKNAMDHTKSGDTIEIKWRKSASIVQIQIKDNGSGIHPEDLHHIFKRFYRSRFSKDQQGIGLGLPLAKMIIEAHNGTIEVNSELGKGTMFIISFLIPTKL